MTERNSPTLAAGPSGSRSPSNVHADHASPQHSNVEEASIRDHDNEQEAGEQLEPGLRPASPDSARGGAQVHSPGSFPFSDATHSTIQQRTLLAREIIRHIATLGLLAFASIWGLLAREGLVSLNTYDGMSVQPLVWAQAVGCLVMGWTVGNKEVLEEWYPPAYVMLTTGFCGSVTTFSTWMLDVFRAFGNQGHYNRHGLHNVMDALTQTALTLGMSLISLAAGKALARVLPAQYILDFFRLLSCRRTRQHGSNIRSQHDGEESLPKTAQDGGVTVTTAVGPPKHQPGRSDPRDALSFDIFSLFLGLAFWAGAGLLCGLYAPFRRVTFALVFGPPGTFLRWYLSRLNTAPASKRAPYWPLGTLAANLLATAVIASLFTSQYVGRISGAGARGAHTVIGCEALYGLQEGFCGCLSTISTFAVELRNTKPRRRAMGYALGSWVCGVGICVLLVGAPWWSLGMDGSCKGVL